MDDFIIKLLKLCFAPFAYVSTNLIVFIPFFTIFVTFVFWLINTLLGRSRRI